MFKNKINYGIVILGYNKCGGYMKNKDDIELLEPKTNNKKQYTQIIILGITLLVVLLGTTYGFLSSLNIGKNKTEIVSGTLTIEYEDNNVINLSNASPLTDEVGMNLTPYIFTVKNTGSLDGKYNISLEEKEGNTLDKRYIKYSIKEGNGEWSTPTYLNTGLMLTSNKVITSGDEITYQIKMWLDENAGNDVQGQRYDAKIVVNTVQTNAELKDIENPIIVLNGNTTIEIEQNEEFIDPGISKIIDKNDLSINDVTIRYEYFDGINTTAVDKVDTSKIGTYYIYYEITDKEGNKGTSIRVVNVYKKDQKIPTIALIGDEVIKLEYGVKYIEYGAQAIDEEEGNITDKIKITGTVNENVAGTYIIKYTISDSSGNISSTTREVIVLPKEGSLSIQLKQDNTDITKAQVDITTITDAEEVKYTITTSKDKPLDKQFKTLEELQKEGTASEDGKIEIIKNGTYYIWVKDANGNVKYQEVVVTTIDETIPSCSFGNLEYVGEEQEKEIELTCTDIADITEKELTTEDITTSTKNGSVVSISAPQRIDNGYKYLIKVKGVEGGEFNLQLKKNSITDGARNGNKLLEKQIKVTSIDVKAEGETVTNKGIILDFNSKNEITLDVGGKNLGELTFRSEDESIAKVTSTGKIQGITLGKTNIIITDKNSGLEEKVLINVEITLTATFNKNGNGVISIEKNSNTCQLTVDNPTSCKVNAPTITVKEGYTSVGWNSDKTSHTGSYELELTKDTTFYTITSKDAITLSVKFYRNGATSLDNNNNDQVIKTCILEKVYNNETQATQCSITTPSIEASTATPIVVGYNESKDAITSTITAGEKIAITKNVEYYAITKSEIKELSATFYRNSAKSLDGNTTSDYLVKKCNIPVTYNGVAQDEGCNIKSPVIVGSTETPTVLGYSKASNDHTAIWNSGVEKAISENANYYAQTTKETVTLNVTYKVGSNVTSIGKNSDTCKLEATYNGEKQNENCSVTTPSITAKTGYTSVGWSKTNGDTTGATSITLTKDETYYANAVANSYTVEYYKDGTKIGSSGVKVDQNLTLTSIETLNGTKAGYTFKGWSISSTSTTVKYTDKQVVSNLATTSGAVVKLYAVYVDDITPSCTSTVTTATINTTGTTTITYTCTDTGSKITSQNLTVSNFTLSTTNGTITSVSTPTAVTNGYKYVVTVKGVSVGTFNVSLKAGSISDTVGNKNKVSTSTNITVQGIKYVATFKAGTNVTSVGSTTLSCTTTGSNTDCSIKLPAINIGEGFVVLGWYDTKGTTTTTDDELKGQAGGTVTLSSNKEFIANARYVTASEVYYDNSKTGVDCTTAQCMIDEIYKLGE